MSPTFDIGALETPSPSGGGGSGGGTGGSGGGIVGPGGGPTGGSSGGGGSGSGSGGTSLSPFTGTIIPSCGLPGIAFPESFRWNFFVTDLELQTLTMLDRLASTRQITYTSNDATQISFRVPSDNPRVNIPFVDGTPKVDEGTRIVCCFRLEGTTWVNRANGIIMQCQDSVQNEVGYSDFTAWDPLRYLDFLPIVNPGPAYSAGATYAPTGKARGKDDIEVDTIGEMILNQLIMAIDAYANFGPEGLFIDFPGLTGLFSGTFEDIPLEHLYTWLNGDTIGANLRKLASYPELGGLGWCEIKFVPVYDPINRPGIIAELNLFKNADDPHPEVVFGWDSMPRNVTTVDRQKDGTQRSNNILFYPSRGSNAPVSLRSDTTSAAKYKRYYNSRYFPTQGGHNDVVGDLATEQLVLRANGVETITISPTPDRAKVPLIDYDLHSIVGVSISSRLREATFAPYEIIQIPLDISDDALESVQQLTLKKRVDKTDFGPFVGPDVNLVTGRTLAQLLQRRDGNSQLPGPGI